MDRRTFLAGAGCGVAVLSAGCVTGTPLSPDVTESETKTYDVDDGTDLFVDNRNGSVTVEGYDGDDVEVEIEKSARRQEAIDGTEVAATDEDGEFRLETEYDVPEDESEASVSLTINCPETLRVEEVVTTHGVVEVSGVAGDATLESVNGKLTAEDVDGTVALSTTNGAVEATGIDGIRDVTTSNGAIDVEVPALSGDAEVRTSNGAISAALDPSLDATVTADTSNGAVDVEGPEFESVERSGTSFSGTLGDGAHELDVETVNGAISITALSD